MIGPSDLADPDREDRSLRETRRPIMTLDELLDTLS